MADPETMALLDKMTAEISAVSLILAELLVRHSNTQPKPYNHLMIVGASILRGIKKLPFGPPADRQQKMAAMVDDHVAYVLALAERIFSAKASM